MEAPFSFDATRVLLHFDLAPAVFPWTDARRAAIGAARASAGGSLFFDDLLSIAAVDSTLYPPQDVLSLRKLIHSIYNSEFDNLKKHCLVYYLLRDYTNSPAAQAFAAERLIPPQFVSLTDGYWSLDNGLHQSAVNHFASITVKPDFTSKILASLAKIPEDPALSATLVLRFIRFTLPDLSRPEDVEIKLDALARTSIREAWMYQRTFAEGDFRTSLLKRIFSFCLAPKPRPHALQALLAFPFTHFEDLVLHSLCHAPPSTFPQASLTVLFDLANVRLISQGRFLEAIKLDRAIGAKGSAAEKRRTTLLSLVRLLPEVQRRILELEMDDHTKDEEPAVNEAPAISYAEVVMGTAAASAPEAPVEPVVAPSPVPLSASQALRTSSPLLAIHRASIATPPSLAPGSPGLRRQGVPFSAAPGSGSAGGTQAQAPAATSPFADLSRSILSQPQPAVSQTTATPINGLARPQSPFNRAPETLPPANKAALNGAASVLRPTAPSPAPQSPFARAAQQASAASHRSNAAPRGVALQRSFAPSASSSAVFGDGHSVSSSSRLQPPQVTRARNSTPEASSDEEATDDAHTMEIEEEPARPSRRNAPAKKAVSPPPSTSRRSAHLTAATASNEPVDVPGAFPSSPPKGTRTSHRRTASHAAAVPATPTESTTKRGASTRTAASSARKPTAVPATPGTASKTRGARAVRSTARGIPGAFAAPLSDEEDEEEGDIFDEEEAADVVGTPPRGSAAKGTKRASNGALRGPSGGRSRRGASEEQDHEGRTPPPAQRRMLRSSVTVSPEAARQASTTTAKKTPARKEKEKAEVPTTAVRRSRRLKE